MRLQKTPTTVLVNQGMNQMETIVKVKQSVTVVLPKTGPALNNCEQNYLFLKELGTSRYFASFLEPYKTIVKLKETTKYKHGKIEKY